MKYRPEIDGLRAFAVVPVILFHFGFGWIRGGYIGVDVFFVISGYLITSIMMNDLEAGCFSFREFWARRIRRILPALLLVTASALTFAYFFVFKGDHPSIGQQALSALVAVANVYFLRNTGDYWGTAAEESPLLHTWSLSVEEQFYFLFPVTVWLVFRFRRVPWLRSLILVVVAASLGLFLYGVVSKPVETFYLLPTRAWELATGCYLAIVVPGWHDEASDGKRFSTLASVGLLMVLSTYFFVPTPNVGLAVAVLGTALVIACARSGICHAVLSQSHIVNVGKISYSLYLWHWPVLVFANYLDIAAHKWGLVGIVFLLSITSYNLVEKPTRRQRGVIPLIAVCYVATIGLASSLALLPSHYDTRGFAQQSSHLLYYDLRPRQHLCGEMEAVLASVSLPTREAPSNAFLNGGIIVGGEESDPKIVVLGDSHGTMWSDVISTVSKRLGLKASFYSMHGVSPFVGLPWSPEQWQAQYITAEERLEYDNVRLKLIEKWKPLVVIVCVRWSRVRGQDAHELLAFLAEHCSHVLLMEQPPEPGIGNRNALQYLCYKNAKPEPGMRQYLPQGNKDAYEEGRALVRSLSKDYSNFHYIPIADIFLRDSEVFCLDGINPVYVDDDHLTDYGARLGFGRIEKAVLDCVNTNGAVCPEPNSWLTRSMSHTPGASDRRN